MRSFLERITAASSVYVERPAVVVGSSGASILPRIDGPELDAGRRVIGLEEDPGADRKGGSQGPGVSDPGEQLLDHERPRRGSVRLPEGKVVERLGEEE